VGFESYPSMLAARVPGWHFEANRTILIVQALRGLAALLVVSVHIGAYDGFEARYFAISAPLTAPLARIGNIGVDLFFIISGFIMIASTLRPDGRSLRPIEFFKRRCIRIYPAVWIIGLAMLPIYFRWPALVDAHRSIKPDLIASYLLLPQAGSPLLRVTWTLVFEMYFYVVFAMALIARARFVVPILFLWG